MKKKSMLFIKPKVQIWLASITLLFIILLNTSCDPLIYTDIKKGRVGICQLPEYVGDTVRISGVYSGFEEYWRLSDHRCPSLKIELDISAFETLPKTIDKAFTDAYDNYVNSSLLLDVKGVFSQGGSNGYGHLGSNNAEFRVIEFVSVKKVKSL
ncbi:hypothetical protein BFP97_06620 [Roseivirga sp. 4D4]|nr:hypothetical protein BFP97_06620 [Roseivirga sp. 4D4]